MNPLNYDTAHAVCHLSLEVLLVGRAVENFYEMKENSSLLCNAVLLSDLILKVCGEKVKRGYVSGYVDSKELEEGVYVVSVRFAVD